MAKMIDELWPVFLAEVTEQLDALELALIKIDDIKQVDIDQLFRLFHTIKSSCAMLDFKNMEEIAHRSEDLLDLARKGAIQLSEKIVDALLEAVDALKGQLRESEKTQLSPGPRQVIIAQLKECIGDVVSPGSKKIQLSNDEPAFNVVEEEFNQLEMLVKTSLDKALFSFSTQKKSEQKSHLIKLRNFFDLMGVTVIKNLFKEAIALNDSESGFDSIECADLIVIILDKIEYLEKVSSRDLLVSNIRKIALAQHFQHLQNMIHRVGADIFSITKNNGPQKTKEIPEKIFIDIQQARSLLLLTGYKNTALLLSHLYQVLKIQYYKQDENNLNMTSLNTAVRFLGDIDFTSYVDNDPDLINALIAEINKTSGISGDASANTSDLLPVLISKLINGSLWKKQLGNADVEKLNDAYGKGCFIFEVYADLESNAEFAGHFIDWLYKNTTVITNIHVDDDSQLRLSVNAGLAFLCFTENVDNLEIITQKLNANSGFLHYTKIHFNDEQKTDAAFTAEDNFSSDAGLTSTLRIDSKTLDRFVSQVGEMVTRRNMMTYIINDEIVQSALKNLDDLAARVSKTSPSEADKIRQATQQLSIVHSRLLNADASVQQVSNRIQEEVMGLRVVPIGIVFNRLPKMVRRLSKELNKNVSLQLSGESVKIDKGLVDVLMEPLAHIVRNAIDHGIEHEDERASVNKVRSGTLRINAVNKGNTLRIEINDDGRGLPKGKILAKAFVKGIEISESASDEDIFNLIFLPGFSTSEVITEISGRGVGMDAVKEKIKSVGGRVTVSSRAGLGTQFIFELPLSVAIQGVVVVESHAQKYALPERCVVEIIDINASDIQSVNNQSTVMLRGNLLPLYDLDALLTFKNIQKNLLSLVSVVVISNGDHQIGIAVKSIEGRHEIYVKDVNHQLLNLPGFGGASILGDGSVVIILDGDKLLKLAEQNPQPASFFLKTG